MTTFQEQVEALRQRMLADSQRDIETVKALGQDLAQADDRLIQELQAIGAQHAARRPAIRAALEALAKGPTTAVAITVSGKPPPLEERFSPPGVLAYRRAL